MYHCNVNLMFSYLSLICILEALYGYMPKGEVNLTGGPVGRDQYYMYRVVIRFNGTPNNTVLGGTIDGIG